MRKSLVLSTACLVIFSLPAGADETASLETLKSYLAQPILEPGTPLDEVTRYVRSRVQVLPEFKSVTTWEAYAEQIRRKVLDEVVFRGEAAAWRDAETKVEWLDVIEGGPGYRIKKLRYEALPGLWVPALLYEPTSLADRAPVFLNVNGHDAVGKATDYKQLRCINQAKRGILALNVEWFGMGQLKTDDFLHYRMNQIDLCGTSGLAPFYLAMKRGLDVLLSLPQADPARVGVAGLSGGGWQTIWISSLDERVTLANPVAGYGSFQTNIDFGDLGDSEQAPADFGAIADYVHLTALRAPRPTLLTYNLKDNCCFKSGHTLEPLLEGARPIYRLYGQQAALRSHVNEDPGTHNFEQDNREQLYRLIGDYFFDGSAEFDANEIASADEIKSPEQLHVELPETNADFHSLALALSEKLPKDAALPTEKAAAKEWQRQARDRLAQLVRTKSYSVAAERKDESTDGSLSVAYWTLKFADTWTVPAVELSRGQATKTAILIADTGRADAAEQAEDLLSSGTRVIAIDPFYLGESQITGGRSDYLFALLLSSLGDRPLGLQASQIAACARWADKEFQPVGPVTIVAVGPRSGTAALVAAALETESIGGVEVHGALGSLKEIIEQNRPVTEMTELFCFGLLEHFDLLQVAALIAPRPVVWHEASERAQQELEGLKDWYTLLGEPFEPVR